MRALEAARQAYEGVLSLGSDLNAQDRAEAERGLGRTLISLAVSYTNEAYDEAAYQTLHRHLELLHPAESRPLPAAPAGGVVANPWEMHAVLTEAYLDVVRAEMARGTVVPESQMALGLLNYSQGEFDRSADCWGAALTVRPDVCLPPRCLSVTARREAKANDPTFGTTGLSALESTVSSAGSLSEHERLALYADIDFFRSNATSFLQRRYACQWWKARRGYRRLPPRTRAQPVLHAGCVQPRRFVCVRRCPSILVGD